MKKTSIMFALIFAVSIIISGCATTQIATNPVVSKDCGNDLACANELVANCAPGTFTEKSDRVTGLVTILEKTGNDCALKEEVALTEFAPFAKKELDKNNDGKYEINCKMPIQKDVAAVAKTLQDNSDKYCQGELLDFSNYILQQMGQ